MIQVVRLTWFSSLEELQKLTGMTKAELWDAGFNLDDWDFGIRSSRRLHRSPTKEEIADGDAYEDELKPDWDGEACWLMDRMNEHCVGPSYVKLGRWHYYLLHHA